MKKNTVIKLLFIMLFIIWMSNFSFSQVNITGTLLNADTKKGIEFAGVILLKTDSTVQNGATTDEKGQFVLASIPKGSYILSASALGYRKEYITVKNLDGDLNLNEILLQRGIELDEIVVSAKSVIRKDDRVVILPLKSQLNASSSAFDLLDKMQLSRIAVNPITRSVTALGGGEVQLRINGVETTMTELQSLRAADILRIDYYDDPGLRYGNVAVVIDYITREKKTGGNIYANLNDGYFSGTKMLNNVLSAKVNHKKSEWALNLYARNTKVDWERENSESFVFDDQTIRRREKGEPVKYVDDRMNLSLNYTLVEKDRYYFNATFRNNYQDIPYAFSDRKGIIETDEASGLLSVYDHSTKRTGTSALDLYYQCYLKNNQTLILNMVGTYIGSEQTRLYQESKGTEILTDLFSIIDGDKYSLITEGVYEKKFTTGKLTAGLKHTQSYTDNLYSGNTDRRVGMNQESTYGYAEYRLTVNRLSYRLGLGIQRNNLRQNAIKTEKFLFRPTLAISYTVNDNLFFRYNGYITGNTPSLSAQNDVIQAIDSFQIRRGNPHLYLSTLYVNSFSSGFQKGIFSFDFNSSLNYENDPVLPMVLFENDKFIQTFANQKGYYNWKNFVNLKVNLFQKHVSLSVTPGFDRYISKGNDYSHTLNDWHCRASLFAGYKNIFLNFGIYTYHRELQGETVISNERAHFINIGYNKPDFSVGMWIFNPFTKHYEQYSDNRSSLTPSRSLVKTDGMTPFVSITASCNIDFGRKLKSSKKQLDNNDTDSGIMSGEK